MENDILSKVIGAEKEIQEMIENEKRRSRARTEEIEREAGAEVAREEEKIQEMHSRALEDARIEAEQGAAGILENAAARADALRGLDNGFLKQALLKHITKILPGG